MTIYINDIATEVKDNANLNDIIASNNLPQQCAVALNNAIVPKNEWEKTICQNNDKIVVVKLVCGG